MNTSIVGARLMATLALASLAAAAQAGLPRDSTLVTPGACVGKICIDDARTNVRGILGKPRWTEQLAGGRQADVWTAAHAGPGANMLVVVYAGQLVSDIHFSSPTFKTREGVSTASTYEAVKRAFPDGRDNEYAVFESGHNRLDWEARSSGITVTFAGDASGPLIRIAVHKKNVSKAVGYSQGEQWYWHGTHK